MYYHRHIEQAVRQRSRERGAVVVTGARQVGKTTLLEQMEPNIPHLTFDSPVYRGSARSDPGAFLELNPPPVLYDEIQYVPELFSYIKISLDVSKAKGAFYLTGSQSFELMKHASESLAGRAGILELLGLSLREIRGEGFYQPFLPTLDYLTERRQDRQPIAIGEAWNHIHRGCFPELVANAALDWNNFYADYTQTYLERDVRSLTQVADEVSFLKFVTVCAAMTGQLLNLASLARDVGISEPTAKRWLSILKTSGIVYLLSPYYTSAISKVAKTPKLYFLDTGLAAYLTRWLTPETLSHGAMSGHFFETFVIGEILKSYLNAGRKPDIFFFRDSNGKEVDLLIFQDNTLYPLEIKQKTNPTPDDIRHFSVLQRIKTVNIGEGGVICLAPELMPLKDDNRVIPLWAL